MKIKVLFLTLCILFFSCQLKDKRTVTLPFSEISNFNPESHTPQNILFQGTLFEGLFGYAYDFLSIGGLKVIPVLAEAWKNSPDGRVWYFYIHKKRYWSNGDRVKAKDFERAFKFFCSPEQKINIEETGLAIISNAYNVKKGLLSKDELGVKAVNDFTLKIVLEKPDFDLAYRLTTTGTFPLHYSMTQNSSTRWNPSNLICNGPYIIRSFIPKKECVLEKNPYYKTTRRIAERIILKLEPCGILEFKKGLVDAVWIKTPEQLKEVLEDKTLKRFLFSELLDLSFFGYKIIKKGDSLLNNIKFRQALAMSINREELVKKLFPNTAETALSIWPRRSYLGKKTKFFSFNIKKAKRLLVESGFVLKKDLPDLKFFTTEENLKIAEFLVQQWKTNLGLEIKIIKKNQEEIESILSKKEDLPCGFCFVSGSMDYFSPVDLLKNMEDIISMEIDDILINTLNEYKIKLSKIKNNLKGKNIYDWEELNNLKEQLKIKADSIKKEPNKKWKRVLPLPERMQNIFDTFFEKWKNSKTLKEKVEIWQKTATELLEQEKDIYSYQISSEKYKSLQRIFYDLKEEGWSGSLSLAIKMIRILQEESLIVPLFHKRIFYLKKPYVSGLMIYKFSNELEFFNFRYLKIKR